MHIDMRILHCDTRILHCEIKWLHCDIRMLHCDISMLHFDIRMLERDRLSQFFSFPVTANTEFKISCENAVFAGNYSEYI